MSSNRANYELVSILTHWILALATLALLGLGFYLHFSPTTTDERAFLSDLHVSLGLTTAIVLLFAILLKLFVKAPDYPESMPRWRRLLGTSLHALIYLALFAVAISGYLQEVFTGATVHFWGMPLPAWGEPDDRLANLGAIIHGIAAYGLGVLILAHIGLVAADSVVHPGFAGRMLPGESWASAGGPLVPASGLAAKLGRDLAWKMTALGWAGFWIQFIFAFLSALLLQFATAGRMLSAVTAGIADGIYWSACALGILILTCALSFLYTRRAKRIALAPEAFLTRSDGAGLWYLSAGMTFGFLGVLASFGGVALSITLLIAKTVSQPPGIAITDPSKIIRALDVFVLLMSFLLLMAHFVGGGISLWLRVAAGKARVKYGRARAKAAEALPPPVVI